MLEKGGRRGGSEGGRTNADAGNDSKDTGNIAITHRRSAYQAIARESLIKNIQ